MLRYIALSLLLSCATAQAEPVPEYALDKDFQNCMGGEAPQKDPQRAEYCNCIRDSMKGWSLDEYGAVATEESKAGGSTQNVPQKIAELAKSCIAKVMK
jgi:hypothetical protein